MKNINIQTFREPSECCSPSAFSLFSRSMILSSRAQQQSESVNVVAVGVPPQGPSEDLEAFEQRQRGGPPFALRPGRLHRDQLGGGGGRQLLVARGGEGRGIQQSFVLAEVDRWHVTAAAPSPPRPPHRLVEDVLDGDKVQTGGHLEEQTAKLRCQSLTVTPAHLPGRKNT